MKLSDLFTASSTSARIFRFVVVGGLAFVLDAGLVFAFVHLGLDVYLSRALSLIVVVLFTYVLNRQATFAATGWPSLQEVAAYVAASLIGLVINYLVFVGAIWVKLPLLLAMAAGTIVASTFNFLAYGKIFKAKTD
ncbi:COG2246 Predicted membrane protein [Caulobacteraceae bacterium]